MQVSKSCCFRNYLGPLLSLVWFVQYCILHPMKGPCIANSTFSVLLKGFWHLLDQTLFLPWSEIFSLLFFYHSPLCFYRSPLCSMVNEGVAALISMCVAFSVYNMQHFGSIAYSFHSTWKQEDCFSVPDSRCLHMMLTYR